MTKRIFVYELPYSVRKGLCLILDASDKWEELGGEHMGFDYTYLQSIRRRESSPTDSLLTDWGNQNHTVTELFVLLSKMQNYRAMSLIKDFVSEQHHKLLREGEELLTQSSSNKGLYLRTSHSLNQRPSDNFDKTSISQAPSAKTQEKPFPKLFKDSKDLGLSVHNMNLDGMKSENKVKCTALKEEAKLKNIPVAQQTRQQDEHGTTIKEKRYSDLTTILLGVEGRSPRIEFSELEAATNGWDTTCILGKGGFGTVYKGTWKNTTVAIKKLENKKDHRLQTSEINSNQLPPSLRELRYLNSHRHDNILSLYGYSVSDSFTCLVYQYMAKGSLEDCLHNMHKTRLHKLNWDQRLNIMTGTARGIQFLHSLGSQPLIHGDIKSANILLDSKFEPRLGDFGLAREGPKQNYTHVKVSKVQGTRPYLPDEFLRGKQFSIKVDTYSFGVVLFEVATGLRAYDDKRNNKFLKDHIVSYLGDLSELADPMAAGLDYIAPSGLLTLGINCVKDKPKERPDMKSVLNDVEMLYNSYKETEKATYLARNRSLTPSNPMQMQVAHDEQRNYSEKRHPLQRTLSPDAHCFCQAVGPVQVMFADQTGLPQPIIIHHPPVLTVQPPSYSRSFSPTSQVDDTYGSTSPLHSSEIPLISLLGVKSEPECKETSKLVR